MSEATTEMKHGWWWGIGAAAGFLVVGMAALLFFSIVRCEYVPWWAANARTAPVPISSR